MTRLSPTSALLVMLGLMLSLWVVLGVEVAMRQVDSMTLAMAVVFTAMMAAWPFLNGVRITSQGAQKLVACRECQRLVRAANFGFCFGCGAFMVKARRA